MIFTSPHPTLSLPPEECTLPHFLLKTPVDPRTSKELLFPPPNNSPTSSNRPRATPLSLDDVRKRAYQTAKSIMDGAMDGKSPAAFKKGNVVAIFSPSQHDYTAIILGIQLVGGVTALCNPSYKSTELAHQLRMTKARCIITSSGAQSGKSSDSPMKKAKEAIRLACTEKGDAATGGMERLQVEPSLFMFEENHEESWPLIYERVTVSEEIVREVDERSQQVRGSDTAVFCFSSGTTGFPKVVALTHSNLIANVVQATFLLCDRMNAPITEGKEYSKDGQTGWYDAAEERGAGRDITPWTQEELGEDSSVASTNASPFSTKWDLRGAQRIESRPEGEKEFHIDVLPQFHCYGLLISLIALHTCTPRIVLPRFHLETFLQAVSDHGVTFSFVVPPILLALAKNPIVSSYNTSTLWRVASGAASLPDEIATAVGRRLGIRCTDGEYGVCVFAIPIVSMQSVSDLKRAPKTVGSLAPNTQAVVVNSQGKELGFDEAGELLLHGPQMMKGYFDNEAANKEAFQHRDGVRWLRTGDVAKVDERGYVTITDRLKDVIKSKGFQVSPAEVEAIIFKDSRVADVAVAGVQDASDGVEKPWAFIVPHESIFSTDDGVVPDTERSARKQQVEKSILQEANSRMAGYKRVEGITWLDALPKSDAGKVLKKNLAALR
ncbi:hypothetical protein CBS101457_004501 [Exobasidium rhododendri]|nr:hypothetical protein CBS101457_004501 [Exobasidium rhododendri]